MLSDGPNWSVEPLGGSPHRPALSPAAHPKRNQRHRPRGLAPLQRVGLAASTSPSARSATTHGGGHFEPGRKLLAHWLVREEIKAGYNDTDSERGLRKQRALAWVMARHIDGSIPESVMASASDAAWDPRRTR